MVASDMFDASEKEQLFQLLEHATSIDVVSSLLKAKGLSHSAGSWKDLREKRLSPALDKGLISFDDLLEILRASEEHGRQHVFLYRCQKSSIAGLLDIARVNKAAVDLQVSDVLSKPLLLQVPDTPTIVDICFRGSPLPQQLVVKQVEKRIAKEYVHTIPQGNGHYAKVYRDREYRAVNLARLRRDGYLELRVASFDTASDYSAALGQLWNSVAPFFPQDQFDVVSLSAAKNELFRRRAELSEEIRFSDTSATDLFGVRLQLVSGNQESGVFEDSTNAESVEKFCDKEGAAIDSQSVFFLKKDSVLSKTARLYLRGAPNEFCVSTNCSEGDYEYILGKIQSLNS